MPPDGARPAWVPSDRQRDRDAYRRGQTRRSTLIALVSTVVVAGLAVLGLVSSPGWPRVKQSFLDPEVAWASLPKVLEGLWLNVRVMAVCAVIIVVVAMLLALARTLRGRRSSRCARSPRGTWTCSAGCR